MSKRPCLFAAAFFSVAFFSFNAFGLDADDPCPQPEIQDTVEAITNPDKYAWRVFVELSQPADLSTKCRDTAKPFGADGPVVWETWRNARESAEDTVYRPKAQDPGPWRSKQRPDVLTVADIIPHTAKEFIGLTARDVIAGEAARILADQAVGERNEVRMNRDAYLFIRTHKFYNKNEQTAMAASGVLSIVFPAAAKEIKAQWRPIRPEDRPRFHWTVFAKPDGTREIWGLTALHIITKDLPNWFWATFEHAENEIAGPRPGGGQDNVGWELPSVDRFACPTPPHNCGAIPTSLGIQGTKWQNYRLRGTQVDFVDTFGRPTRLASSQMEAPFQGSSSCMNCHALAAINKKGRGLGFDPQIGPPSTNKFLDPLTGKIVFMQNDFVFSLIRASSP